MNPAVTQSQSSLTYRSADQHWSQAQAKPKRRTRGQRSRFRLLVWGARGAGAVAHSVVALLATVAAMAAAVVALPLLLLAPVAVVGIVILLIAYVLGGLGLI